MQKTKCGIIGCGNISDIYFKAGKTFDAIEIAACADIIPERAAAKAKQHGVPKARSVDELLADPEIEIIINLTIPKSHAEVALAALDAGKSIYNEKPLALTREEGAKILDRAKAKGLRVGCAPDTFLGAGLQTCRKLVDDGWIGEPIAATAFMMCHGHEDWHPDPDFYYQPGGGPLFDMGPYYLTALISLMGPIRRVCGSAQTTFPERTITSAPKRGTSISVNTPTHIAGILDFASGAVCTLITSFDVWDHHLPHIEIYGTEGSLSVPDPNNFGGSVLLKRGKAGDWKEIPHSHDYAENSRGLGVADMAVAIAENRQPRANGELGFHILDVMHSLLEASRLETYIAIKSKSERPLALPMGLEPGPV